MEDSIIAELTVWWRELGHLSAWYQLAVLLLAAAGAWAVHRSLGGRDLEALRGLQRFTLRSVQRVMFPFTMLLGVLIGRAILHALGITTAVLNLAVPLLLSLAAIRVLVYGLRKGFSVTPMLKAWENIIGFTVWALVALHLLGWLPAVLQALDDLAITFGSNRISLLSALKLVLLVGLLMTLAFWLSGVLERRMKASPHVTPALQVALIKFSKFFLLTLAVLLALNAVGIDLTTLTVFGGALGVGIGFGLQRIASNFISGFILVLDRSIKPGDVITVGDRFGWVEELRARYVVVRNRDGVETLIPNENLITSEVINWSYTDRHVRVRIPVQISYKDDPEQAMALMLEAVKASDRVVAEPAPSVRLMEFADNGILLELRVWIDDPEEGVGTVRSAINLAIWRAFRQAGISFPYPQRDLYIKEMPRG
ncbi:mechanosensitive ion channel family protein [Sulfurivermis fontis]|uniref:mechanosensitive ion channel family protein n=1 Tax=Sulfurivermis fontis TaxID=1972068 RepID=UPI001E532E1C|nr:mechanosensitive ion channel domain-containing protein [Sulfurivermis fontis]